MYRCGRSVCDRGRAEGVALAPGGLATGLDERAGHSVCRIASLMCSRISQGPATRRCDHCYAQTSLAAVALEINRGALPYTIRPRRERGLFVRPDCEDSPMEIEIGRGKKGRRAYGFDDIAIVPSRRTRDPDDIDISWKLGPYQFELPMLASAMDGVVSPRPPGSSAARRPGGAQPRGHLHALRGRRGAARADRRACPRTWPRARCRRSTRAGQAGADRAAHPRNQGAESRRRGLADPAEGAQVPRDRAGGRSRRAGDPGHGRLRRARLDRLRAAEPEGVHPQRSTCRWWSAAAPPTTRACT